MASKKKIVITKNGAYIVSGGIPLFNEAMVCDKDGFAIAWKKGKKIPASENYLLCRCGKSKKKPFCDNTHIKEKFDGTERASLKKYSAYAEKFVGPRLTLTDNPDFCNHAGFCTTGIGVWEAVSDSNNKKSKKIAIKETCNCPTGRLVIWDKKTGKAIEPKFEESISVTTEPEGEGALWVKGGIQIISSSKKKYEKRNRVALCRCGKSSNMPFCDGAHLE
ncbi:MAG: CDGSH iron-sulfur domain-containing protein [archaeon]